VKNKETKDSCELTLSSLWGLGLFLRLVIQNRFQLTAQQTKRRAFSSSIVVELDVFPGIAYSQNLPLPLGLLILLGGVVLGGYHHLCRLRGNLVNGNMAGCDILSTMRVMMEGLMMAVTLTVTLAAMCHVSIRYGQTTKMQE
jgi:hypothetical protein